MGTTAIGKPLVRELMTEERKVTFLAEYARTGSFKYASAAASGLVAARNGTQPKSNVGEETFRQLIKNDPEFAEAVAQARTLAVGNLEAKLIDRIDLPNTRPVLDKAGNVVATEVNYRDCNVLLLRALERFAPGDWVQRRQVDANTTVTHTNAELGSGGHAYVVQQRDILVLEPEERVAFMTMIRKIENVRNPKPAAAALPAPGETTAHG